MFCPECGTQNPDTAKFCVSCGYQTPLAGGTRPQPAAAAVPVRSGSKGLVIGGGLLALLVIGGLVAFIFLRGSNSENNEAAPTPRAKTASNSSTAASPATPMVSSVPSASSPAAAAPTSTPDVPVAATTPPPAPKPTKKPVNCNKKCVQVFDRCMAEYGQIDDVEMICSGKRDSCLSKCS